MPATAFLKFERELEAEGRDRGHRDRQRLDREGVRVLEWKSASLWLDRIGVAPLGLALGLSSFDGAAGSTMASSPARRWQPRDGESAVGSPARAETEGEARPTTPSR
jgi:hypothetical protein